MLRNLFSALNDLNHVLIYFEKTLSIVSLSVGTGLLYYFARHVGCGQIVLIVPYQSFCAHYVSYLFKSLVR